MSEYKNAFADYTWRSVQSDSIPADSVQKTRVYVNLLRRYQLALAEMLPISTGSLPLGHVFHSGYTKEVVE